jgi:UDP-N-acetylglucosamine acyltransferase
MAAIHPTAIIEKGAEIDRGCEIGPYAVIGPRVKLGARTKVGSHAVIDGDTTIGADNKIFPHAAIGGIPQDLKYAGEPTKLVIGEKNQIREFATIHIGTAGGGGVTRVGSNNLFMANSHVAHDVQIADSCVLANSCALAGHVVVEDHVICGGLSAVHQFTRLGRYAFISGGALVVQDVPPYCTVQGDRATLVGLNTVGLTRAGFNQEQISRIKGAYKVMFRSKLGMREACAQIHAEYGTYPEIEHFVRFIEGSSERGFTR